MWQSVFRIKHRLLYLNDNKYFILHTQKRFANYCQYYNHQPSHYTVKVIYCFMYVLSESVTLTLELFYDVQLRLVSVSLDLINIASNASYANDELYNLLQ